MPGKYAGAIKESQAKSSIRVAKWLSIDERQLVNWKGRGVLSLLNFVDNGVCYFDWEWAGEATTLLSSFAWRA